MLPTEIKSSVKTLVNEFYLVPNKEKYKFILSIGYSYKLNKVGPFVDYILDYEDIDCKRMCMQIMSIALLKNPKIIEDKLIDKISFYLSSDDGNLKYETIDTLKSISNQIPLYRTNIFSIFKKNDIDYFEETRLKNFKLIKFDLEQPILDKMKLRRYVLNFCQNNFNYNEKIVLCKNFIDTKNQELVESIMQCLSYIVVEHKNIEWDIFVDTFKNNLKKDFAYTYTEFLLCNVALFVKQHSMKAIKLLQRFKSPMLKYSKIKY